MDPKATEYSKMIQFLRDGGHLPPKCTNVIIEYPIGGVVKITYECLAPEVVDDRLAQTAPETLAEAEVSRKYSNNHGQH
jgi:hypothetical protein